MSTRIAITASLICVTTSGAAPAVEPSPTDAAGHWAFQAPVRPAVPDVANSSWVRDPIDAFVARRHEQRDLTPRPEADRATLLRRVYVDLIGLPPTRRELHAFLADSSDDAYERTVDRLLADPRYGQRWGRHWMDIWRYSDWYGRRANNELRNSGRHIWRWRDWIIESLNADKGYDRMILEMLAGDELAPNDSDTLRATGYLARNYYVFNRNVWLQDTVEYTGMAMLGLTLRCCRCHDHKYDPITQREYFALRSFFEPHSVRTERLPGSGETIKAYSEAKNVTVLKDGLDRAFDAEPEAATYVFARGDEMRPIKEHPVVPAVPEVLNTAEVAITPVELPLEAFYPDLRAEIEEETVAEAHARVRQAEESLENAGSENSARSRAALASARADLTALEARFAAEREKHTPDGDPRLAESLALVAARAEQNVSLLAAESALLAAEAKFAEAQSARKDDAADSGEALQQAKTALDEARQKRDAASKNATETPGDYTPIGATYPRTSTGRRLALARWIASPTNPLAARVAVNHIWLRHVGSALVPTVYNFGLAGQPPTHPDLLDWLAAELIDSGYSMKHLHRRIVTSATYRMHSAGAGEEDPNLALDPENVYLWRMNPRRIEAEVVRDTALHLAGKLDSSTSGEDLDPASADTIPRRSLYFRHTPDDKPLLLELFDAANPAECFQREESVTPQQALALINSGFARQQAAQIAIRLENELRGSAQRVGVSVEPHGEFDRAAFVEAAFEHVLTRRPTDAERRACVEFLADIVPDDDDDDGAACPDSAESASDPAARVEIEAARRQRAESLIHVLMNYNEFVTVR